MSGHRNFRQYTLKELYEKFGEKFPERRDLLVEDVKERMKKFLSTLRKMKEVRRNKDV